MKNPDTTNKLKKQKKNNSIYSQHELFSSSLPSSSLISLIILINNFKINLANVKNTSMVKIRKIDKIKNNPKSEKLERIDKKKKMDLFVNSESQS